jgi:amino acid transporter
VALTVLELSSRLPGEGGLYLWSQAAFGDLHGFIAGWIYWISNLVFFPSMLLFGAGVFLYIGVTAGLCLPSPSTTVRTVRSCRSSLSLQHCRLCGTERQQQFRHYVDSGRCGRVLAGERDRFFDDPSGHRYINHTPEDSNNPGLFLLKTVGGCIVLIAAGLGFYFRGHGTRARVVSEHYTWSKPNMHVTRE